MIAFLNSFLLLDIMSQLLVWVYVDLVDDLLLLVILINLLVIALVVAHIHPSPDILPILMTSVFQWQLA